MEVIKALMEYGTAPALVAMAALIGWILKKLSDNDAKGTLRDEAHHKHAAELKDFIVKEMAKQIQGSEQRIEKRIQEHQEWLDAIQERLGLVERDHVPRDEHYRDFSGWRGEIVRINDKIDRLGEKISEAILSLMKRGKE